MPLRLFLIVTRGRKHVKIRGFLTVVPMPIFQKKFTKDALGNRFSQGIIVLICCYTVRRRWPRLVRDFFLAGVALPPGRENSKMTIVAKITAAIPARAIQMLGVCVAPLYACISNPARISAAEKG